MEKQQFNEAFEQAVQQLNPAQRKAVDTIEGPVMVIAGPGTGKTQVLAARIGNILLQQDVKPENILCLTFTEAGVIAMRNRLAQFIGPDAYRASIYTFHSFCNTVIQDHMDRFGLHSLELVSEIEQMEMLHELIDEIEDEDPLKRWKGEMYYEAGRMKQLFSIMKTEGWTSDYIIEKTDAYIELIPELPEFQYQRKQTDKKTGKVYQKGDLNPNKYEKVVAPLTLLKSAVLQYDKYEQKMKDRGLYDYNDMILWVLELFKTDENVLLDYQERYQYFLVDEYQDTNGAQNDILQLLISYFDQPNVFVVGDDDQSIFRFQGANIANIQAISDAYKDRLETVVMTQNYRSNQQILDAAHHLIELNQERVVSGKDKILKASHPNRLNSNTPVNLHACYNEAHETMFVAQQIKELHKNGTPLNEVAIIFRNHKQIENLVRFFDVEQIPYNVRKKANILDSIFIQKLINILRYIEGETQLSYSREDLLFEILHYDFFEISPLEIAKIAADIRYKYQTKWRNLIGELGEQTAGKLFPTPTEKAHAALGKLSEDLEFWIGSVHNLTLQGLFEKIITRGKVLAYIMKSDRKIELMQELSTFFDFIKSITVKTPDMRLKALLQHIDLMQKYKIAIPISKSIYNDKGVQLLTAHSSKGLEFEHVFLFNGVAKEWDKKGKTGTYAFPEGLVHQAITGDSVEESRRLFFVAMTRAKEHLHITYPTFNQDGKELQKSRFIAETESAGDAVQVQNVQLEDDALVEYGVGILTEHIPNPVLLNEQYINQLLSNYSMSVTHLNTYLRCPVSFYFQNLLRVPAAKSEYMTFGSGVHYALERLFKEMLNNDGQFHSVEQFVKDFEWFLNKHRDAFVGDELEKRLAYGKKILPDYYNHYINEWPTIVSIEKSLRNIEVGGVPINGKIDKLEFDGLSVNVVDYKTGGVKRALKKCKPPKPNVDVEKAKHEEIHGGDYWRQAVFYKILIDQDATKNWEVLSTTFDFIEPEDDQYQKEKIMIKPEDIETVKEQIQTAFKGIQNHEFERGCGDENCKWCNFVKYNFVEMKGEEIETV